MPNWQKIHACCDFANFVFRSYGVVPITGTSHSVPEIRARTPVTTAATWAIATKTKSDVLTGKLTRPFQVKDFFVIR